ncbi:MAG: TadE family protein [Pseudomonadota bacterium]
MTRRLLAFLRCDKGAASLEFVMLFPLVFAILVAYLEMGWLLTKQMMLDRGVDVTMRQVRIGAVPNVTHDLIKQGICDNALILIDCDNSLKIQLIPYTTATPADFSNVDCFDRSLPVDDPINVATQASSKSGDRDEIIFVRACVLVDFLLPGGGIGFLLAKSSPETGYSVVSYSAFMNEPV